MTISMRLPSVERLIGDRLSNLTEPHLAMLGASGIDEDSQLDFKQTFLTEDKDTLELAKDVCALANARGGLIVYGIAEHKGRAAKLTPFVRPIGDGTNDLFDSRAVDLRGRRAPADSDPTNVHTTRNEV